MGDYISFIGKHSGLNLNSKEKQIELSKNLNTLCENFYKDEPSFQLIKDQCVNEQLSTEIGISEHWCFMNGPYHWELRIGKDTYCLISNINVKSYNNQESIDWLKEKTKSIIDFFQSNSLIFLTSDQVWETLIGLNLKEIQIKLESSFIKQNSFKQMESFVFNKSINTIGYYTLLI